MDFSKSYNHINTINFTYKGQFKMKRNRLYQYQLFQDGFCVASVESYDKKRAAQNILHYALMYSADGPVIIKPKLIKTTRRKK